MSRFSRKQVSELVGEEATEHWYELTENTNNIEGEFKEVNNDLSNARWDIYRKGDDLLLKIDDEEISPIGTVFPSDDIYEKSDEMNMVIEDIDELIIEGYEYGKELIVNFSIDGKKEVGTLSTPISNILF
jgi:hypothetical protein